MGLAAPLNLAVGLEYLRETYRSTPGDAASYAAARSPTRRRAPAGPACVPPTLRRQPQRALHLRRPGAGAGQPAVARRGGALFRLQRFRHASTGKLSARYKFTDNFLLRGSLSNSFRAPALVQTGFRFATLNFNSDGSACRRRPCCRRTTPWRAASALKP
ncbi:TonB-dependent receptor domain-containing protein [Rugamonas sp. CCM 8940]|uniref:TonB-dependent receptor domain-containing protein n=1 Tax=Rugamonas sp. CCM 8940 TaxID=2765359 RepID=UPI003606C1F9